jgi:hypothetical protein
MGLKQNRFCWISLMIFALLCIFQFASVSVAATLNPYGVLSDNPYVVNRFIHDGKWIDEVIFPGRPPESYRAAQAIIPEPNVASGTNTLSNVPAFDWSYGCSATSAAMMFGYYDNAGYPNIYTGPTNGGVIPMNNAVWGSGECPLSATHLGIDGRAIRGHVDDYWIAYGSSSQDPFIGNWTEHTQGECTGDFMATNQSSKSNSDGSTTFFFYTNGSPLYDFTGNEPAYRDGCHGMRLFFESRGYTVSSNYSQYIMGYNGNTQGFTFEDYKQEIDAGRPVMIQVVGHSMLGYGYDDSGTLVYLRDTWDYNSHSMTWGGSYSAMQHYGVTVFVPASAPQPSVSEGSIGTELTIAGFGFGDKKGKVLLGDVATKITSWTDTRITGTVKKVPLPVGPYYVSITSKTIGTITLDDPFNVKDPELGPLSDNNNSGVSEDEITVYGNFFGIKKGKVYLEYLSNGQTKKKNCKVTFWYMNPKNGASELRFVVPKLSNSFPASAYPLKVDNKIGIATASTNFTILP